jgi:hypothetical protein
MLPSASRPIFNAFTTPLLAFCEERRNALRPVTDETESVLVKLTRMEGKLDLSNMRHDQHDERFRALDGRINNHGQRIGTLEARDNILVGERQGIGLAAKVLPFLFGGAVMAGIALVARAAGL